MEEITLLEAALVAGVLFVLACAGIGYAALVVGGRDDDRMGRD